MKNYKVGIIGLGDISDKYINNLKKYNIVEVHACASRGLEKARITADRFHISRAYSSGEELIQDPEIDIVLNLTPPSVHSYYNIAALQAGKHIYTEKPLGTDLEGAKQIIRLSKEKKLYVGCAPDTFMGGRLQTVRNLLDRKVIGEVIGAGAYCLYHGVESFHPNPFFFYQTGAGPLLDIGPYYMTALLSLLGPVKRCSGMSRKTFNPRKIPTGPHKEEEINVEVDTHIIGNLEFHNGALANIITSFDVWESEMPRLELYGTEGTICLNDPDPLDGPNIFGGPILLRTKKEYRWNSFPRQENPSDWINVPIDFPFTSTSHQQNSRGIGLIDMALAIRDNRPHRASGDMAYHSLEVMTRILEAARESRYINIESSFNIPAPLGRDFPESEMRGN